MQERLPETEFSMRHKKKEQEAGLTDTDIIGLDRQTIYERLKAVIGNRPILETPLPNGNILLQVDETAGPTESHYDRAFVPLLEALEKDGKIGPDADVLETSSGSAGISFGWAATRLGFRPHVFMPSYLPKPRILETQRAVSPERTHLIDDRKRYIQACAEAMVDYLFDNGADIRAEGRKIWMPNHSQDSRTPGFFAPIADEVESYTHETPIDYFIAGIGNGSTLLGIGNRLREHFPDSKVIGFEPHRACPYYKLHKTKWGEFMVPILGQGEEVHTDFSFHDMPGTGSFGNIDFPFINEAIAKGIMNEIIPVDERFILSQVHYNEEAKPEHQFGHTTLVARHIAEQMAQNVSNKTFLALAYDRADRYGNPRYV